jgi:DNA-binding CsgD family transcriptional regulator
MTRTVSRAGPLLEREAELDAVTAALDAAAAGGGGVLAVEGPAGIGKTRLLDAARAAAAERGFRVLVARASPLEREFGFGVVRALLEPVLRTAAAADRTALLDGAARLAGPVLDPGGSAPPPTFATLHGIYWLLAGLAERRPLLLAVDDAHWADGPSLRALHHLARRIEDLPILLAVTARPPEAGGETADLLEALRGEEGTILVRPRPLSAAATALLVRQVFPARVEDEFAAAVHRAGAGNPLLVDALARSLAEAGVAPVAASLDAVRDRAPGIVGAFVLPRLRHLPKSAATVARALAVLGSGPELRHLAAVAGLDPAAAAGAVEALRAAELVAGDPRPAFVHPLVAQAVADRMPAAERHQAHRRAAEELAADGAPAEAVAAHLLDVAPLRDPWVVERLRDAARAALAKGAPEPAVGYLSRALAEPPPPTLRAEVLFELGAAETHLGPTSGLDRMAEALDATRAPADRARMSLRLARGLQTAWELPRGLAVLARAVAEADAATDLEPELRTLLEAEYIGLARSRPACRADALRRLERLLPTADPGTVAGCVLLAASAVETMQVPGRTAEAVGRARAALAGVVRLDSSSFVTGVLYLATPVLAAAGDIPGAVAAAEAAVADARARGAPVELGAALGSRAEMSRRQGALLDAESDARLSLELAGNAGAAWPRRLLLGTLLPVLLERGETAAAQHELDDLELDREHAALLVGIGRLRLAQDRPAEALDVLTAAGARLAKRAWVHPGLLPWSTDAALACHRLGRVAEARGRAEAALVLARRYDSALASGIALRTVGQLTDDLDALAEAASVLGETPARVEHARALVELGAGLRRANHRVAAREPLRAGLDLASRTGSTVLVRQAVEELAAAGGRPRTLRLTGLEALSPSERRVARLAADGGSNRDIAQALFVTTKTVEVHLSACYRKLGISSRAELPGVLR